MVSCKNCGERVGDMAVTCPKCGMDPHTESFVEAKPAASPVKPARTVYVQQNDPVRVVVEQTKFCQNCGATIDKKSVICPNCGVPVTFLAQTSPKSRLAALLLCGFLGAFGIHRFYVGKIGTGILWLCTLDWLGVGALVDFIVIACGGFRDSDGLKVRDW